MNNEIIEELLEQNKRLRLELAVLEARLKFAEELDRKMNESRQGISQEVLEQLSPQALDALSNMRFTNEAG